MNQELSFGVLVRERRSEFGLSQTELAARVGCAPVTIRKIEYDALRPSVDIAEHLALALKIPEAEQLAFIRLARREKDPSPLPYLPPALEEIGREDLTGRSVKGFDLAERIGAGGYGAVYRAVQAAVERDVAVKIILPKYADNPDFIRRFEAEAQLVARLEHPHIVPLYDYWREPGVAYLIMRYLRGGSLDNLLHAGPLAPETILAVMEQICAALHAAHRADVIHRDIKPANILLDEDGNAYLADFGIAKNLGQARTNDNTLGQMVMGSPAYISPEQILVEPVKSQADIYSLGVMLYELLTGQKPFRGPTPIAYIRQHLDDQLPLLAEAHQTSRVSGTFGISAGQRSPTALDIVIGRATAKDPRQRYPDILSMLADLRRAIEPGSTVADMVDVQTDSITPSHVSAMIELPDLENPYKGLRAFSEADSADFFGRTALVQSLLVRMAQEGDLSRFLAVIGPSGSGKSSAVRAGLLPALRQGGLPDSEKWFIVEMIPGAHPLEELEAALLRVAVNPPNSLLAQLREDERSLLRAVKRILPDDGETELVLLIDQFEEIFTLVDDEALRRHLLDSLVTAVLEPGSRLRLIITMRADFIDRPLQYVDFGELVRQRTEFVLPLTADELEQAITGPTHRAGLRLESGLVSSIINEIGDQPGMLPLLQYALTELFEHRHGRKLTLAAYQASGGVLGALARRAEEIYEGLNESEQELTRQIFLRLVTPGDGVEDTRRRVLRSELLSLVTGQLPLVGETSADHNGQMTNAEGQMTIDQFGKYRLLSFDHDPITRGPTVEVAHEALLREWGRLRLWLDASRNDIRMQRLLATAAAEWREANRDASFLLHGARLDQFAGWVEGTSLTLTSDERAFLQESLADRRARQAEEEARQQRELEAAQKLAETESRRAEEQTRAARRLRWLAAGLAIFLVAAGSLAIFAFKQQSQAVNNLALSESQRLAAEANTIMSGGGNAELAALLSLRALNTTYTAQADMALQQASTGDYGRRLFLGHTNSVVDVAFSPDGRLALSGGGGGDNTARLWNISTGQELYTFTGHTGRINSVAFSPDGQTALTGSDDKTARLWDIQSGQELRVLTTPEAVNEAVFSPDGRFALTGSFDGSLQLWDLQQKGQEVRVIKDAEGILATVFSPDGQYVLTGNVFTNEVRLWEVKTGQEAGRFTGATGGIWSVAFSPDGHYILASDSDGGLRRWDLRQPQAEPLLFAGHTAAVFEVKVSPDGRYALSASEDNTARLWDIETGQEVRRFVGTGGLESVAFSPDGQTVLIGAGDGTIRLWGIQPPSDPRTFSGHTGTINAAVFSPDGRYLLTGSTDKTARLWNVETGQTAHVLSGHTDWVEAVAFSPDGRYALTTGDNRARLWNVETGQEMRVFTYTRAIFGVAFSPDGRYILTGGDNEAAPLIQLWDAQTGQVVRAFTSTTETGPPSRVTNVAFSPTGQHILTGSWADSTARLWDTQTGREVLQIPGFRGGGVNGLVFSPDGKYFLTAADENSSQLWDLRETGSALGRFSGGRGAFSLDGKYLLTGGFKTAYLWDRATGRQLRAFGAANNLSSLAISPDSQWVLIAGTDKIARLWDLDYHRLIDSVCARVLRDFTKEERAQYGITDNVPACPQK